MFHLITIEDKVRVPPSQFNNELQTIEDEIEKKYTNKVLTDGGLFIALYDILGTGDAFIYSGDGGSHLLVRCRLVVFKPFIGEILEGVIKKTTPDYIQISVGFFDEIINMSVDLPIPCFYNEQEQLWFWEWNENQLFFEDKGRVRFKVDAIEFNPGISKPAPRPKIVTTLAMDAAAISEQQLQAQEEQNYLKNQKSPMILKVSMRDSGLGMVSWWAENQEEQDQTMDLDASEQPDIMKLKTIGTMDDDEDGRGEKIEDLEHQPKDIEEDDDDNDNDKGGDD